MINTAIMYALRLITRNNSQQDSSPASRKHGVGRTLAVASVALGIFAASFALYTPRGKLSAKESKVLSQKTTVIQTPTTSDETSSIETSDRMSPQLSAEAVTDLEDGSEYSMDSEEAEAWKQVLAQLDPDDETLSVSDSQLDLAENLLYQHLEEITELVEPSAEDKSENDVLEQLHNQAQDESDAETETYESEADLIKDMQNYFGLSTTDK